MVKLITFTKISLLIVVSGVVKVGWNSINKSIIMENNNKCCIGIIKWQSLSKKKKILKKQ